MKSKKILNKYSPKKIEEAIKICDNLFYGKYLETGELKTREELQQHIKEEVAETFVKFWGKDYAHEIVKKILGTRIHFVYQVDGPSNSLDAYLVTLKSQRFNERYHTEFESPIYFKHIAKELSKPFMNPVKTLQKALKDEEKSYNFSIVLKELKIDKDKVIQDDVFAKSVVEQIKTLGKQFNQIAYSVNPSINQNLVELEKLVFKVGKNLRRECNRRNIQMYDALFTTDVGIEFDPLVAALDLDKNAKVMLRQEAFAGLKADDSSDIYYAIKPGDDTVLHEFIHEVDNVAFQKGKSEWVTSFYSDQLCQNQMFNEVITDYFAMLMKNQRKAEGKSSIVCDTEIESEYSYLFNKMGKFLDAYLPELKVIRLREYPAEEFARIIGVKNFDDIAVLCNELIALKHDLHECEMAQENDTTLNDLMADSGVFFYGSMDFFADKMQRLHDHADRMMDKSLNKALRKQSLAKRLDLFLADKTQKIAGRLEKSKNPKLSKLAINFSGAAKDFKNKAQNEGLKKLQEPLQNIGKQEPLLLEDKRQDEITVAEK